MNTLSHIQEELINKNALMAEINVKNISPVIIGGYNARPYSDILDLMESVRPTEIKGVWRWWARALVSGVLLRKGIKVLVNEANTLIAPALGGMIKGELKPSKITIDVEVVRSEILKERDRYLESNPRLKLLKRGLKNQEVLKLYSNLELKIKLLDHSINTSSPPPLYGFGLASLIISLIFSGIGALTTRAFGSVKITDIKLGSVLSSYKHVINIVKYVSDLGRLRSSDDLIMGGIEGIKKTLSNLIDEALSITEDYVEEDYVKQLYEKRKILVGGNSSKTLPSIPSLLIAHNVFRFEVLKCQSTNINEVLERVSQSVLKQNMKRPCFSVRPTDSGKDINTYILGLPRSSVIYFGNIKLRTGYVVPRKPIKKPISFNSRKIKEARDTIDEERTGSLRRVSAIGFSLIHDKPPILLTYGMLAEDINELKNEIIHRGVHGKTGRRGGYVRYIVDTPLSNVNAVAEFDKLWNCILSILRC